MAARFGDSRTPSVKRKKEELSPTDIDLQSKKKVTMMADSDYSQGGALFDIEDTSDTEDISSIDDPTNHSDLMNSQDTLSKSEDLTIPETIPDWAKDVLNQVKVKINDITTSLEFAHKEIESDVQKSATATKIATQARTMSNEIISRLGQRILILEEEKRQLQEKVVKLETHSRQRNLVFYGFAESRYESDVDCYRKVMTVIRNLGLNPNMPINRCHRLGPYHKHQNTPRPIIVSFHWFGDRNAVWNCKQYIKRFNNQIYVSEDFPEEIQQKRRILYPAFKKARSLPAYRGQVSLQKDKLIVANKVYTVDNMHTMPDAFNPWHLNHQEDRDALAFFGIQSPFSNFHPAPFRIDGVEYCANEQYLFYKKANMFNDMKASNQIMATKDPYKIKKISKRIKNVDEAKWKEEAPKVMKQGLLAKFKQNPHLKHRLLATGQKKLIEGSKTDKFWGVGLSYDHPDVLNQEKWPQGATNVLGKLLEEVRDELAPFPLLLSGAAQLAEATMPDETNDTSTPT